MGFIGPTLGARHLRVYFPSPDVALLVACVLLARTCSRSRSRITPWRFAVFGEELIIDGGAGNSYSKPVLVFHELADGRKVRTGVCYGVAGARRTRKVAFMSVPLN
jgi:hypothetical protein